MRRREFITLLGSAAAWPLAAGAQQVERMRRLGVLLSQAESDPVARSYITAFTTRLRELGWTEGKNLGIDYRWGSGNTAHMPPLAKELVGLQPDALLAATAVSAVHLRQYTLTIPIVFTQVGDPVAPRVHHPSRRRGGVAARGACAAAGGAGDRVPRN